MKLGFIGTGKIASSVITGICTSKISFKKIFISPRNRNIAQKLKKRFRKVNIAKNNQEVVDKCNWIFLGVTPKVGKKILSKLKYRSNQKIISFISTINLNQLKKILGLKFDAILFDNMSIKNLKVGVKLAKKHYTTEASGNINLKSIKKIAATGVDRISIGSITHSVPAIDLKLEI